MNFAFSNGLEGVNVCAAVPQYDLYDWIINYKRHLMYIMPDEVTTRHNNVVRNSLNEIYYVILKWLVEDTL